MRGGSAHILGARKQVLCVSYFVPQGFVSRITLSSHFSQQRFFAVDIVVDNDLTFCGVQPMQSTGILSKSSTPGYRHREKKRFKPIVIQPLAEITACRNYYALFTVRDRLEGLDHPF